MIINFFKYYKNRLHTENNSFQMHIVKPLMDNVQILPLNLLKNP